MTAALERDTAVVAALEAILGSEHVISDRTGLGVYELDASDEAITGIHRPLAAVLPATTEQVSQIARVAAEHDLPLLARGSGTGLAGGAIATRGGIMVVTTRMHRIEEVSLVDRYAVVQPGVVNLDL
jgi:glycolate oxidase